MIKPIFAFFRVLKALIVITHYGGFKPLLQFTRSLFLLRFWIFICGGYKNRGGLSAAMEHLGPAYIKIGQFLATRRDILPLEMCEDLARLQDRVPSFPKEHAIKQIETEFECKISDLFSEFSDPIAAASVAQVHFATLKENNRKVAIKILRPNIHARFDKDIYTFFVGAKLLNFFIPKARRLKFPEVVEVFSEWVKYELDLRMEAASISEYHQQIRDVSNVVIPNLYWEYTGHKVLTMQFIEGTPLTDLEGLKKLDHNLKDIARQLMQLFLNDATSHGFFHGDLHQGNIIITPEGKIALLDFGVMGRLDERSRNYLARILYGFVIRDYKSIARLHFEAGYVSSDQNVNRFAQSLRAIGEPLFDKMAGEISMARVLSALFAVTENFRMETRPELILLQKNMVSIEGICGRLDPTSNIWVTARPLLEDWVKENLSPQRQIEDFVRKALTKLYKQVFEH